MSTGKLAWLLSDILTIFSYFRFFFARRGSRAIGRSYPGALLISAFAKGCGAVGPSPIPSPAASIVWPLIAPPTAVSIISSAKRRVALSSRSIACRMIL